MLNFDIVLPRLHPFVKSISQYFYEIFVNFNTQMYRVPKFEQILCLLKLSFLKKHIGESHENLYYDKAKKITGFCLLLKYDPIGPYLKTYKIWTTVLLYQKIFICQSFFHKKHINLTKNRKIFHFLSVSSRIASAASKSPAVDGTNDTLPGIWRLPAKGHASLSL